jgi:type II secretory pathway component GspD/PulD (secretin)
VTKHLKTLALVFVFALASTAIVDTQEKEKAPAPAPKAAVTPVNVTPLKVQVVIARYQGEKKISSMPYALTMNAGNRANLRMGTQVPIVMLSTGPAQVVDGKTIQQVGPMPIQYKDVGTNLDCSSMALDDGRFLLSITVEDSSVYPDEQSSGGSKGNPSFRSFRASNSMVLKNSETGQFTVATDKVSGETVKVDVTLTVMK